MKKALKQFKKDLWNDEDFTIWLKDTQGYAEGDQLKSVQMSKWHEILGIKEEH